MAARLLKVAKPADDLLFKRYGISPEDLSDLKGIDNGDYLEWLVRHFTKGNIQDGQRADLKEGLQAFTLAKKSPRFTGSKDIAKYSVDDILNFNLHTDDSAKSNKQRNRDEYQELFQSHLVWTGQVNHPVLGDVKVDILHFDSEGEVYALKKLTGGPGIMPDGEPTDHTGWCTIPWESYEAEKCLKQGDVFVAKVNGKNYAQMHEASGQLKDADDDTLVYSGGKVLDPVAALMASKFSRTFKDVDVNSLEPKEAADILSEIGGHKLQESNPGIYQNLIKVIQGDAVLLVDFLKDTDTIHDDLSDEHMDVILGNDEAVERYATTLMDSEHFKKFQKGDTSNSSKVIKQFFSDALKSSAKALTLLSSLTEKYGLEDEQIEEDSEGLLGAPGSWPDWLEPYAALVTSDLHTSMQAIDDMNDWTWLVVKVLSDPGIPDAELPRWLSRHAHSSEWIPCRDPLLKRFEQRNKWFNYAMVLAARDNSDPDEGLDKVLEVIPENPNPDYMDLILKAVYKSPNRKTYLVHPAIQRYLKSPNASHHTSMWFTLMGRDPEQYKEIIRTLAEGLKKAYAGGGAVSRSRILGLSDSMEAFNDILGHERYSAKPGVAPLIKLVLDSFSQVDPDTHITKLGIPEVFNYIEHNTSKTINDHTLGTYREAAEHLKETPAAKTSRLLIKSQKGSSTSLRGGVSIFR